jgi:hypothetical protein
VTLESTKKRRRKKNTSTGIWGEVSYDGIWSHHLSAGKTPWPLE